MFYLKHAAISAEHILRKLVSLLFINLHGFLLFHNSLEKDKILYTKIPNRSQVGNPTVHWLCQLPSAPVLYILCPQYQPATDKCQNQRQ